MDFQGQDVYLYQVSNELAVKTWNLENEEE